VKFAAQAAHLPSQTNARAPEVAGAFSISSGVDAVVTDKEDKSDFEAMSGPWCASLGFRNSRIAGVAARNRLERGCHQSFNRRANRACEELADAIASLSPQPTFHRRTRSDRRSGRPRTGRGHRGDCCPLDVAVDS